MRQNWVGTPDHADTRCSAVSSQVRARGPSGRAAGTRACCPNRDPVMNSGAVPEMWKNGVAQIDAGGGASGAGGGTLFSSIATARPYAMAEPSGRGCGA